MVGVSKRREKPTEKESYMEQERYFLLLIMVCLAGEARLQIMIVVSRLPEATRDESGDQATQFTLALWKPHSLL